MTDPVTDLVAYLAGDAGTAGDRCRRALADPGSDLSHFLTAARERTRAAIAEPAFRGLGLSPAACLPPDLDAAASSAPAEKPDRRRLPWLVAAIALLVAGLSAWAPWRAGAAAPAGPAGGGDKPAPANQVSRGEARPGPVLPDDPVAARRAEPTVVAAKPSGPPAPPIGVPAKTTDPVPPKPPAPADERTTAVEDLAKKLQTTQNQAADLERRNAVLQGQVTALTEAVAQAGADCDKRAAELQKTIDTLKPVAAEASGLAEKLRKLQAEYDALKARLPAVPVKPKAGPGPPPIDPVKPPIDPIKPKVGLGPPPIDVKPPMVVKPPVEPKKKL
jgi:hypothetical protein